MKSGNAIFCFKLSFLFLAQIEFCECTVETSVYYYEPVPLSSWSVQFTIPNVHLESDCVSQSDSDHGAGNCCYMMRYDPMTKVCECGKKLGVLDWTDTNIAQIMSRISPETVPG